jgi:predicted 2-oxoglutarate/Fe(II)-dependent dioxygenase YbiX
MKKEFVGGHNIFLYRNVLTNKECKEYIEYFDSEHAKLKDTNSEYIYSIRIDEPIEENSTSINQDRINLLNDKIKNITENAHQVSVKMITAHCLVWNTGAFGNDHSDDSDIDGLDIGRSQHKLATILYLNNDYGGGELIFRDHDISLKPEPGSIVSFPGGIKNIHRINDISSGKRYSLVSFFDIKN